MKTKITAVILAVVMLMAVMSIGVGAASYANYEEELTRLNNAAKKVARVTYTLEYNSTHRCFLATNAIEYYDVDGFDSSFYNFPAYMEMNVKISGDTENDDRTIEKIGRLTSKTDDLHFQINVKAGQTFISSETFFETNYYREFNGREYLDNTYYTGAEKTLEITNS